MCDVCTDFQQLLESYEARINDAKHAILYKSEIETTFGYIQAWSQRQCMCLYRDAKNFERFNMVVQSMIYLAVHHLKHIDKLIDDYKMLSENLTQSSTNDKCKDKLDETTTNQNQIASENSKAEQSTDDKENINQLVKRDIEKKLIKECGTSGAVGASGTCGMKSDKNTVNDESISASPNSSSSSSSSSMSSSASSMHSQNEESWILLEVEKLFLLVSKVFLLNFPLYIAYKHGTHSRLDDISAEEASHLAIFCDLHDNEIPVYLLRNICLFCNSGGFAAMMLCFEHPDLPVTTAHAITATVSNIKLWLNYGCIVQLFVPLRSRVLQYMCNLSDQNLRTAATRAMADFVWSAVRDPLDAAVSFDVEGLALAFKYFTSTTLTMRLAGIAQINAHINIFGEIESVGEVEIVAQKIAHWLTENQIIQHLFGPNLHVEVLKQAHIVLNFLAVENQITEEHIKLIWQATQQLKHCSKTIFDILPSLVKNLAPKPAMYLYTLLCRMDPKEHTEQSIYIASALTKLIWSRDKSRSQISLEEELMVANATATSSDCGSMDGSNSDDGNCDDSSLASARKSPIDIENVCSSDTGTGTGAPPCKQARRRRHVCDSIDEKVKEIDEDISVINPKVDMKMKNHRIVNIIDNSSSEEDLQGESLNIPMHRKKSRKRRKNTKIPLTTRLAYHIVEAICDGGGEDEASSEDGEDAEGEILNDSDDCSDPGQVPSAVLKHLQGEGPYIRAIAETHISELLSGAENDGSYSSPMSAKSEKNMADFDDEDVSPCEEELAQLVNTHSSRVSHNCMPPAFAAAAAAMAAAHTAMSMQKTEANVAAAAAAVAAAAVATGNAQQSLLVMQQANAAAAMVKAVSAVTAGGKHCNDVDIMEVNNGCSTKDRDTKNCVTSQQPTFRINDVCQPGNTLLWDLLQDDKIGQLGESLALEAEKALATLLCFSNDRVLRTKFIEGCLYNLANNKSVIVSLRLLPKLFASFQQFRPSDTHQITMWAERQHKMTHHFFNNIKHYSKRHMQFMLNKSKNDQHQQQQKSSSAQANDLSLYSHKTQVSVRLHFLSSIFSSMGSPKTFRLSLDQVDALWEWLAHDAECADCYFSWLQSQAKGGDQHALGLEALQHLYLKKLPELRPEDFSMVALGLFQQLCSLARMAIAHYEKQTDSISTNSSNIVGMYHLWKIALRAHNTEVSLAAIQYINMYYMGQQLRFEREFVSQCMEHLVQAANALESNNEDENALMCVQRGLMLLNTHLEIFRRRYAFHLRRWAIEGQGIGSHSNLKNEGSGPAIRIILQPNGLSEKSVLHMHACDLIAELKAEISKWWENLQGAPSSGVSAPVLGLLLSEGPLRIITQGQELSCEYDERTLLDAGFKDNQIVYVSLGGRGARRKETNADHPSMQPPPPKDCLPTVLLLQSNYFEKLFRLMQTLGDMKPQSNNLQLYTKAQLLSRRVWDILAILPTNPMILDTFKSLSNDYALSNEQNESQEEEVQQENRSINKQIKQKLTDLLDPKNLQKFMYSLHIVESLALNSVLQSHRGVLCCSGDGDGGSGIGNIVPLEAYNRNNLSSTKTGRKLSGNNNNSKERHIVEISAITKDDSKMKVELNNADHQDNAIDRKDLKRNMSQDLDLSDREELESNDKKEINLIRICNNQHKIQNETTSINNNLSELLESSTHTSLLRQNTNVNKTKWSDVFIKCGGLKHLYDIFISGQLQQSTHPKELLNEWRHDCLASLLRILWLLGFEEVPMEDMHVALSQPKDFMLGMMAVGTCLMRLSSILTDEAFVNYMVNSATDQYHHHLRTGFWGRAQVVQFTMNIMVSFVHASAEARQLLWSQPKYCNWVQKFILDDPEPAVRREICAGLYRICLGNAQSYRLLLAPLLRQLISFLPSAEKMTSYNHHHNPYMLGDDGKEPYGPACRDYFWLLARLVDTISPEMVKSSLESSASNEDAIDIEKLCQSVARSILSRDFYETRFGLQDDGLVGLINLMSNLVKYDPTFKFSSTALEFIEEIFKFLFDMPSPSNRQKPKCKSATSRAAAYDLLVELCKNCPTNYTSLHAKLLAQHRPDPKSTYPWDYWPRDEGRSECGYVGLTNLGATCYMASCIQHLYMMPQARSAILNVYPSKSQKHGPTLIELQRMFAYLLESERKAYNPRSFCRVYQMDHQPLNTGEQKDMAEFFIDLVSKLEEMTPDLKDLIKRLFCGTLSNNVVSLDCDHVSRTAEEFYTVRCQVADMRNLMESLDEVTVKDTLEGDNMYTCSQCGKKVRAEKRACFKKLPQILCFNTMRYTFNMVTMLKEKVNTHFSFPMRLNMSDYVEKTLMPHQYEEDRDKRKCKREHEHEHEHEKSQDTETKLLGNDQVTNCTKDDEDDGDNDDDLQECLEYELVGVTVHTGTADGGHYYSFIKERNKIAMQHDRWFLFNDAEVKPFDPSQIAAECFGGEMTSKTYDSVTEKYLDFSFEKTNSAYMLFYERCLPDHLKERYPDLLSSPNIVHRNVQNSQKMADDFDGKDTLIKAEVGIVEDTSTGSTNEISDDVKKINESNDLPTTSSNLSTIATTITNKKINNDESLLRPKLGKDLEDWIWQDNRKFLQDRNIFEHTYFNFMWQICGHIPQTLMVQPKVTCMAAKLSISFFIETFIHAKEKPTMVPWVELLTKQFNASQDACEWFLNHMSLEPWWPIHVLIQCPNQIVRQMFQRLVIHVIQKLRLTHVHLYLETSKDDKEVIGSDSCVTRFIASLIKLMEQGAKAHLRHLSEYFSLLYEFARMGDEETLFLLRIGVIKSVADFYLGNKTQDCVDATSDNDDNSSDEACPLDKNRPASLDKMIALVASLVERSRGPDLRLKLSTKDYNAIAGGKGFPFLYQQIKDNINPHQTKHLIYALCRWDERLANQIILMLFASVTKHTELCGPFFKLLTLLTENQGSVSGLPCFSQLVLQRVWDAAEYCPQSALDWLAFQAPKNKIAHAWVLQSADTWVEQFLLAHNNSRVRNAAAYLLVSLVPSQSFRANFRTHSLHKLSSLTSHTCRELSSDAQIILHNIINLLLRLLRPARAYADINIHGTTKLTSYFSLLGYCMISKTEKLMMGPYMRALWDLFHPRLSEPSVPAHHNKHALLAFWHHTLVDTPENATIMANCPEITRNIAFNYILADHDDSEIVAYNRAMLPAYYGLLRLCCEQSRNLTRQLAAHQNLQWAFKNITPHPTQYSAAVDELFKLMALFANRYPEATDQEKHEITAFRRTTLSAYLGALDARVSWGTLINALRILIDNDEDRLLVIYNGGIELCFEALHTLHSMHHEATACHVANDLQELLSEMVLLLSTLRLSARLDSATTKKHQQQLEQHAQQLQVQHQQLFLKQQEQLKQQQQQQQAQTPQQNQKEKQLQHQMQQIQLQQMQQQLQHQHFLRQQHQHTALLKGLPDAIKRLATFLNTYNPPDLCRLSLDVLREMVRNPNLDVINVLAPILINCHLSAVNASLIPLSSIGPLGPYFPRRGSKSSWPVITKNMPRPPRPMVQMAIPQTELTHKGVDLEYDAQLEAFYRPYHDFLDVMMRMAVNTNQLNDTLVKLSCLIAIEAAPLHFNLFPKFWVGIYNNKTTNKYVDLLINNQYLVEYIHIILRNCRVSLSDQYIRAFLEIYYPKISTHLPIARLLYTISYSMHSKEDLDDLCGDLFAIRVIAQSTGIPTSVRKQLRGSLKALLHKSARYKQMVENGISEVFANKKLKLENSKDGLKMDEIPLTTTLMTTTTATSLIECATKATVTTTTITTITSKDDNKANRNQVPSENVVQAENDTEITIETDTEAKVTAEAKITSEAKITAEPKVTSEAEITAEAKVSGEAKDAAENDTAAVEEVEGKVIKQNRTKLNCLLEKSVSNRLLLNEKSNEDDTRNEKRNDDLNRIDDNNDNKDSCEDSDEDDGAGNRQSTLVKLKANKNDKEDTENEKLNSSSACNLLIITQKNPNKKTADDRILAEHEKRIKLLLTMETYIKNILALMQKDESNSPSNSNAAACTDETIIEGQQTTSPVPESSEECGGGNGGNNGEKQIIGNSTTTITTTTIGATTTITDSIARNMDIVPKTTTTINMNIENIEKCSESSSENARLLPASNTDDGTMSTSIDMNGLNDDINSTSISTYAANNLSQI